MLDIDFAVNLFCKFKCLYQIFVRVTDIETDLQWMWPKDKFLNRKFVMQEMFQKFEDDEDWKVPAVSSEIGKSLL